MVFGAFGGRIDQTLSNINTALRASSMTNLPVYLLGDECAACILHSVRCWIILCPSWILGWCDQTTFIFTQVRTKWKHLASLFTCVNMQEFLFIMGGGGGGGALFIDEQRLQHPCPPPPPPPPDERNCLLIYARLASVTELEQQTWVMLAPL